LNQNSEDENLELKIEEKVKQIFGWMKWIIIIGSIVVIMLIIALFFIICKKVKSAKRDNKGAEEAHHEHKVFHKVLDQIYTNVNAGGMVAEALLVGVGLQPKGKRKQRNDKSKMGTVIVPENKKGDLCPLCSRNFQNCTKTPKVLPGTDNLYHSDCLAIWVRRNRKCPSTLHNLQDALKVAKSISVQNIDNKKPNSFNFRVDMKKPSIEPDFDENGIESMKSKRKRIAIQKGTLISNIMQSTRNRNKTNISGAGTIDQTNATSPKTRLAGDSVSNFQMSPANLRRMNLKKKKSQPKGFSKFVNSRKSSGTNFLTPTVGDVGNNHKNFDFSQNSNNKEYDGELEKEKRRKQFKKKRGRTMGHEKIEKMSNEKKRSRRKNNTSKRGIVRSKSIDKFERNNSNSNSPMNIQRFASPGNVRNRDIEDPGIGGNGFTLKPKLFTSPKNPQRFNKDDNSLELDDLEESDISDSSDIPKPKLTKKLLVEDSSLTDSLSWDGFSDAQ